MRVLVVAYACEPNRGGEPEVGWQLATHLAAHGDVTVVTRSNNQEVIERDPGATRPGLHFMYVDSPPWLRFYKQGNRGVYLYQLQWQILALRSARQVHRQQPFDVVHHVTFSAAWYPSLFMFLGVPLVWGPLATSVPLPTTLANVLLSPKERRVNRVRRWLNGPVARLNPLVTLGRDRAAALPAVNASVAASMAPRHRTKVSVLPAVGTDRVPAGVVSSSANERLQVIMIGRLIGLKAVPLALTALARIEPATRPTLRIVGDGPALGTLRQQAVALGIGHDVTFAGALLHPAAMDELEAADVLLYPAFDPGGMVVIEAMSRAKPVICLDIGGPAEAVDTSCGFLIRITSVDDMSSQIAGHLDTLNNDRTLLRTLGQQGRSKVESSYLWEAKAAAVAAMLEQASTGKTP